MFINFPNVVIADGSGVVVAHEPSNPFLSLCESCDYVTVWKFKHGQARYSEHKLKQVPNRYMGLRYIHDKNVINEMPRGGERLLSIPEEFVVNI